MSRVTEMFDDIEHYLKRDGKTIGDLARDLGYEYQQVYDWVRLRRFNPRAEALLQLQAWRDQNKKSSKRVSARTAKLRGTQE
jgi:hypothetical protein